jgi:tetratricopeptide (TPR) repeat protein
MKAAVLLLFAAFMAASALHFDITDARGKKPSGVSIIASDPDIDDWYRLKVVSKGKIEYVLVWPFDGKAKVADGPEAIPAVVIEEGDAKALAAPRIVAYRAVAELLGAKPASGLDMSGLAVAEDPFLKGVRLLYESKPADAVEPLARALRERERQLTRIPSEIYPAAMLYGRALFGANKFDDAAVAYLKAMNQRPSDGAARKARAEALIRAGKPEAAEGLVDGVGSKRR